MKGVLQNKNNSVYITTELLQRSRPYFGSQMGAKEIHFLLYRSSDSWQLHLRVDKAAQILQCANATKFQQFSSCSKSIVKPSVAFRSTSASIRKQINTANKRAGIFVKLALPRIMKQLCMLLIKTDHKSTVLSQSMV